MPLSDAYRNRIIEARENLWYPEPERENLLAHLDALSSSPLRHRTRSIAIIAEANGGKSGIINRYLITHPPVDDGERTTIPTICVEMADIKRVEELSVRLLEEIAASNPEKGTHAQRMKRFIALANRAQLRVIFLDEFHDCADTSGRGRPFLRCIKRLILAHFIVVPVGVSELKQVLARDPQLASRFNLKRGHINRITEVKIIKAVAEKIAEHKPVAITDAAINYILQQTFGVIGYVLDMIEETLVDHGNLSLKSLQKQYLMMPNLKDLGELVAVGKVQSVRKQKA
jgi:Bacterial TniB protein